MHKSVRGYIRRMTKSYLNSRCTVQKEVIGRGDWGQNANYWDDVAVDVHCRKLPGGQGDTERAIEFAGQDSIDEIYRMILPASFELEVGQRIIMDGVTYYVAALLVGVTDEAFRASVIVRKAGADG